MGGCRCSYKNCTSATKTTVNLHFFHYPIRDRERCAQWIANAEKPDFINLPEDQLRNKVVCGLHFEEKCFINTFRKRLIHCAIPTLDGDGTDPPPLEVLPTSVDGTSFTLQGEHLQSGSASNETKYGYNNGKLIVHTFDESEVYTINPSYFQQSCGVANDDIFIQSDPGESPLVYKISDDKEPSNLFIDEMDTESEDIKPSLQILEPPKSRVAVSRKVLRKINAHAQEIASIKKSLVKNQVKLPKKRLLRLLKGKMPDSLLGALSLHLNKTRESFSPEEMAFLQTMNKVSPHACNVLRDYGWYIPKHSLIHPDE